MRDQSNRRNYKLKEETSYTDKLDQKLNQPHYPSWDSEELDLTARYQRVENYTTVFDWEVMHKFKNKPY